MSSVEVGINRVTELIKADRLHVFKTCRGLLDELESYKRKTDAAGNITDEISDKRKFHRLDALRYAACGITEPVVYRQVVYEPVRIGYY